MFSLLALNFYGLMEVSIRIQSILETHGDHIAQMTQFFVDHVNQTKAQTGQREAAPLQDQA
jgi:hypothetical protein